MNLFPRLWRDDFRYNTIILNSIPCTREGVRAARSWLSRRETPYVRDIILNILKATPLPPAPRSLELGGLEAGKAGRVRGLEAGRPSQDRAIRVWDPLDGRY